MSERLQLKGKLSDLKIRKMELATKASANINAVRSLLATAAITPLEEIKLKDALVHMTEAYGQQREYLNVCGDIKKIKKELE